MNEAMQEFVRYAKLFDLKDPKIMEKFHHTFRVIEYAKDIARSEGLSDVDVILAMKCALLHDVARFRQFKMYHTYVDAKSFDHGDEGARILGSNKFVNRYTKDADEQKIIIKVKEFGLQSIEELTTKFIDYLRSNKLYPKFFYFNYNPNAINSIQSKKSKLESTSVILYNSTKEYEQMHEQKDTLIQKSTIKEKELNIDLDKKPNTPTKKKIFIKKYNNIKLDQLKKNTFSKSLTDSFFVEKYFLSNNNMLHMLFNNVFVEAPNEGNNSLQEKENLNYPINQENDHVLLFLMDLYDKAQQMFGVSKNGNTEYLDIVNYIELNLTKPEVLLTKNKLAFIKYKYLFVVIQIEIYEDKNYWSTINSNTNFYKEIESLFSIVYDVSFANDGN